MVWLALVACSVELPDPTLEGIAPDRGWNGEETVVAITGTNFLPQVEIDASRAGSVDLDRGYRAWLVGDGQVRHQLSAVAVETYGQIRGVVRPGLAAGPYDLVVEGPTGRSTSLLDAFTVSDTRADRLTIDAGGLVATVNGQVVVEVQLVDPSDEPVLADLEVELRAEGTTQTITGFFGTGLDQASYPAESVAIRGFLGPDGRALVPLTVGTPDTVVISVEAIDPTSGIRGGEVRQLWQPGDDLRVEFDLPSDDFVVDAGESFQVGVRLVDQFGNDVQGVTETVLVQSGCQDVLAQWTLTGDDTFTVTPRRATDYGNCPSSQILRVFDGLSGQSEPFEVRAGPADSFRVTPVFPDVRAGEDVLVQISARDAFDNLTAFPSGLHLTDSVGGLGQPTCELAFNQIDRTCTAQATVASDAVTVTATAGSVTGTSSAYRVLASLEVASLEVDAPSQIVAGESALVDVTFFDPWGNTIDAAELDLTGLRVLDGDGQRPPCDLQGPHPGGSAELLCMFEQADPDTPLTVGFDDASDSVSFQVVNGPVEVVAVDAPADVVAGASFDATLQAFDAFGNPYLAQVPGTVRLEEPEIGVLDVVFDASGTAQVPLVLTLAGETVLAAIDTTGDPLGLSGTVRVAPGPAEALQVQVDRPWLFVGDVATVSFQAVDGFGNLATDAGTAAVRSQAGASPEVTADLVAGSGSAALAWDDLALDDRVVVEALGLTSTSRRVDAVLACDTAGPQVGVDFAGAPTGRACVPPSPAPVAISFASSLPGDQPIAFYRAQVAGELAVTSNLAAFNVAVGEVGRNAVALLVVDGAGCGAEGEAAIWAGPDDGQPVGALVTAVGANPVVLGDAVGIDVIGAVDCTGDPATGTVRVRANRGEILGATATGEGLEIPLDASGSGSLTLDTAQELSGGVATLVLESPSGGAYAAPQLTIEGDDRAPVVWGQSPLGDTTGTVSTVVIDVSEPLLPATVVPSAFVVEGTVQTLVASVQLVAPTRLELTLETPVDAATELRTVVASSELRDLAGNRLDGELVGAASDWEGRFGPAPNVLEPVQCTLDVPLFRPDGDDGTGAEADQVVVTLTSTTMPAWWRLSIDDEDGELLRQIRVPATATSADVAWAGQDQTGKVVADGIYTLRATAEDATGNRATPCVSTVTIDNQRSQP